MDYAETTRTNVHAVSVPYAFPAALIGTGVDAVLIWARALRVTPAPGTPPGWSPRDPSLWRRGSMTELSAPSTDVLHVVVTACCGRDVSWLGDLFSTNGLVRGGSNMSLVSLLGRRAHLTIYDKGGSEESCVESLTRVRKRMTHPGSASCIPLPNAPGREAHTVAYHFSENWHRIATVTTFLHADTGTGPGDHMAPLFKLHKALWSANDAIQSSSVRRTDADARVQMLRHVAATMHNAAPSSGAACLCSDGPLMPLCEDNASPWQCPADVRRGHNSGSYTGLVAFVMRFLLGETTWPGIPVAWCPRGSLTVTAEQARFQKPAWWWAALLQLFEKDHKIRSISGLRMAHVAERLWLRIFSPPWFALGSVTAALSNASSLPRCFARREAMCCVTHNECCCPTSSSSNPGDRVHVGM